MICEECDRDFDPAEADHVIYAAYPVCDACNQEMLIREGIDKSWTRLERP